MKKNNFRRKSLRLAVWKTVNVVVAVTTIFNVSLIGVALPQMALADAASIWTTQETCLNPADQDANEYANGDTVYVRGKNFEPNTTYYGTVSGQPGNASNDPGQTVETFQATTDGDGYFCVDAYVVGSDGDLDDGVYTVDVWDNPDYEGGSKNDNYHVTGYGSLTVHKQADTDGNGSFEITVDSEGGFAWKISGSDLWRYFGTSASLTPGVYQVEENNIPGYHFVGWRLGQPDGDICAEAQLSDNPLAGFEIGVGDEIHITYCNQVDMGISGTKYYDWDRDGETDEGDQPLGSWQIDLHQVYGEGSSLVATTNTDSNGDYGFMNLQPGEYMVCEQVPNGWQPTGSGSWKYLNDNWVFCQPAEVNQSYDFHNYLTGQVHGQKWNDLNGNGVRDCSYPDYQITFVEPLVIEPTCEPSLNGWTVFIDDNKNGALDQDERSMQTQFHNGPGPDDNGWYWFTDMFPGLHQICEVQQVGWNQTYPINANGNCHTVYVNEYGQNETSCYSVSDERNVENAIIAPMCNFGNQQQSSITVNKHYDDNGDGTVDRTNPSGWTWDIVNGAQDNPGGSARTVAAGSYTVAEDPSADYSNTWSCSNQTSGAGPSFSADLTTGQSLVCTFVNTKKVTTIGLEKSASPTQTNPLTVVTYTIKWNVGGNTDATNVVLTDPIPTNMVFVSANDGGVYNAATKTITWTIGTKTPVATGQVTWVGQVAASAPAGQIINTASIDSDQTNPAATASATVINAVPQVLGIETQPALSIVKVVDQKNVKPGDVITYTITVTNTGDGDAENVTVVDTLPTDLSFVDGSGRSRTWDLGTLAPGASQSVSVDVRVESDAEKGDHVNIATATADGVAQVQDDATVNVNIPKVLGLATTGASTLDAMIAALGALLVWFGIFGLRRPTLKGRRA